MFPITVGLPESIIVIFSVFPQTAAYQSFPIGRLVFQLVSAVRVLAGTVVASLSLTPMSYSFPLSVSASSAHYLCLCLQPRTHQGYFSR